MNTITPAIRRELVRTCNRLAGLLEDVSPQEARDAERLAARIEPRKKIAKTLPFETRKESKKKKRLSRNRATSDIRAHCSARASGVCECGCGQAFDQTFLGRETLDHFDNGTGKSQRQNVKTGWMLRWDCHLSRQALLPNVVVWNRKFREHCARNNITSVFQHIEHQRVARRA